jgi:hypothetical protein
MALMLMKHSLIFLTLLSCFLLSSCGRPSNDDITKAVQAYDRAELQKQLDKLALSSPGVGNVAIKMSLPLPKELTVTHLKTSHITKNDKADYVTTISYVLQVGDEKQKMVEKITLTKTKDGWKVNRHGAQSY